MVHPGFFRPVLVGLFMAAFFLAGCGGGGDDISRSTHDMLQEELDDALALLANTETERDTAEAALSAANAEVARLTTELGSTNDSVMSLTDDLSDAEAEVTRLTNQVGSVTDPTSLQGLLAAANADVGRLTSELTSANAQVTDLMSRLTSARAEVTRLQGRLETTLDRALTAEEDLEDAEDAAEAAQRQAGQLQGQLTEAQRAELRARADTYYTELDDNTEGRLEATVSYPRAGRLAVDPSGGAFTRGSGAPSVPGFSGGHRFTLPVGLTAVETAYIYTNIQSAGTRAFWKISGAPGNGSTATTGSRGEDYDEGDTVSGAQDGVSGVFTCVADNWLHDRK